MGVMTLSKVRKLQRWGKYNINAAWEHLENCGRLTDFRERLGSYKGIKNVWKGKPCYVIGGSSAARGFDLNKLDGKNTITCNHMIEVYDKAKWFLFMDHRFLRITKYNLANFKGKIFVHNTAPVFEGQYDDMVFFKTININREPTSEIEKGLYSRSLSGMCILNLAIISGANPIYMLGLDHPKDRDISKGLHYNQNYTGEGNKQKSNAGVEAILPYFSKFGKWGERIINVCENPHFDWCESITLGEFESKL